MGEQRLPKRMAYDRWLFFTAMLLVLGGLLMVGSSSTYVSLAYGKSPSAFFLKQLLHVVLGFVAMRIALNIPYRNLDRGDVIAALGIACFVALIVVLAMPGAGGARRWLLLGPFKLQPSEFVKLFVVVFLAWMLSRKESKINELRSVLAPCGVVVLTLAWLIYIEPDLGSSAMLVLVAGVMIFAAGLHWKYITIGGVTALAALVIGVVATPYRWERVRAWLAIWSDPASEALGANFQLDQSLLAIGSGGLTGAGLGQGYQKAFYVPASHTDFIFSVIGEELGLIGTSVLVVAFLLIFWRGMRAAVRAPDRFGYYLALGVTSLIVFQALTNMAVCLGLLPTKGLPLPLISYGGSSLLASMTALGLLFNVSQHSN